MQLSLRNYLANATHLRIGGPQPERSVEYGKADDGTKLLLDVWLPKKVGNETLRPAVVKLHGGGWTSGRRGQGVNWNRWLSEHGYAAFDVEYRLAPQAKWKDEVGDVKCALGFVASNAARYQIDPARISTWGHSAGGNLAMLAAYSMGDPVLPASCDGPTVAVRSVVNFYGPADLTASVKDSAIPEADNVLMRYVGGSLAQYPDRYRILSPINHVGAKSPPTITFLGARDRLLPASQALALDRALAGAGVIRETYLLPGSDHSFDANWGGFATQFARAKVGPFLARHR